MSTSACGLGHPGKDPVPYFLDDQEPFVPVFFNKPPPKRYLLRLRKCDVLLCAASALRNIPELLENAE